MVHNKPIISLRTMANMKVPSIDKYLTQETVEGDFRNLLEYMADPSGDEYNPALEDTEQKNVAEKIISYLDLGKSNPDYKLRYLGDDEKFHLLNLEDKVGDSLGRILRSKTNTTETGVLDYKGADLVYWQEGRGGR